MEESSLSHCYCRFSGPKKGPKWLVSRSAKSDRRSFRGSEIAGNRGFAICRSLLLPAVLRNRRQISGVAARRLHGSAQNASAAKERDEDTLLALACWHPASFLGKRSQRVTPEQPSEECFSRLTPMKLAPGIRRFRRLSRIWSFPKVLAALPNTGHELQATATRGAG